MSTSEYRSIYYGREDRFTPERLADDTGWLVFDREKTLTVAGPYATEVQAVYVAAALSVDASLTPFAPDVQVTPYVPS